MDVKVDFLAPTMDTIRQSLTTAWAQLPPPVQQAAPYVGVAAGSGLVVFVVQQRRLNNQVGVGCCRLGGSGAVAVGVVLLLGAWCSCCGRLHLQPAGHVLAAAAG